MGQRWTQSGPPDASYRGAWQDPTFGYYETHGRMEFKKGEQYDLSPKDRQAVAERHKIKEILKLEYIKRDYHPERIKYVNGVTVDPALFRWYAADMQLIEVFRLTPKTVFLGLIIPIVPLYLFGKFMQDQNASQDRHMRKGNLLWWDRQNNRVESASGISPWAPNAL